MWEYLLGIDPQMITSKFTPNFKEADMKNGNISEDILSLCRKEISEKYGSLDDIPYELANSLVNT